MPDQSFRFNWAWISLEKDKYTINETEEYLHVTLKRRGYLGETSFVGKIFNIIESLKDRQ